MGISGGDLGELLGVLGALLGSLWASLGSSLAVFGALWEALGLPLGVLEWLFASFWVSLGLTGSAVGLWATRWTLYGCLYIPLVYRGGGLGEEMVAGRPPIFPKIGQKSKSADDGKRFGTLGHAMDVIWLFIYTCLLYTSPSPRDKRQSRMPSSA